MTCTNIIRINSIIYKPMDESHRIIIEILYGCRIDSFGFPNDFLWIPYERPMDFHMISEDVMTSYGFPMDSHWSSFDFVGLP